MEYDDLLKLEKEYGESFYLSDRGLFRKNLIEMRDAFRKYYEKTNIAYSFKTNYMPAICEIVREEAAYAEVVSEMEYELAKRIGFPDNEIYYNGPYKKKHFVLDMLKHGVRINIDNWQEYEMPSLVNHSLDYVNEKLKSYGVKKIIIGDGSSIIRQYPLPQENVSTKQNVFLLSDGNNITMPNMTGWSLKDVKQYSEITKIPITVEGSGSVTKQSIKVGLKIDKSSKIKVTLK